jgi:hypothetical protein
MIGSQNTSIREGKRLTVAGLIAVTAATLLMMSWAVFPAPASGIPGNCPNVPDDQKQETGSGFVDLGGGNTISWGGDQVTVTGNVTICIKAGNDHDFFTGPGTYTLECYADGGEFECNRQGNPPGISHIQWDLITTTTTTPPEETTTTTPPEETTTTTPPEETTTTTTTTTTPGGGGGGGTTTVPVTTTTTPTVGPTTVEPSTTTKSPIVAPTTVSPRGTAFTGVENVVPIGAIALMLMTSGTGLLWAGSRRKRDQNQDEE